MQKRDIKTEKETLRQSLLAKRMAMTAEEVHQASKKIGERLLSSAFWQESQTIALYSPVRNEVETQLLLMTGLEKEKKIYLPRVEQGIRFYEVDDPLKLQKGAWGILEPTENCVPLADGHDLDLILVPGIVFDERGYRIGYGKGFYDAVLNKFSAKAIALAYDFQVMKELQIEAWDKRVHGIVTEKRELNVK